MYESLIQETIIIQHKNFSKDSKINHIIICGDRNVRLGLGITIFSICKNSSSSCLFHIFFNGNFLEEDKLRLKKLTSIYDVKFIIYKFSPNLFSGLNDATSTINSYITKTAYYRLLVPYVLYRINIR